MKKANVTVEELANMYLAGNSLQQIANIFGVTREAIRQRLANNGYIIRDMKTNIEIKQIQSRKKLADDLLIESTNREIKVFYNRARLAETKYANACKILRKYRKALSEAKKHIDDKTYLKIKELLK